MGDGEAKIKVKHQLILKGSSINLGFGIGVLVEKPLEVSPSTLRALDAHNPSLLYAKTECDTEFLMEHVEVRMVREETSE